MPRAKNDALSATGPLVQNLKQLPKSLDGFVTRNSLEFFRILEIPSDFLQVDPTQWPSNESNKTALNVVQHIRVVNDTAERGVAFAKRYQGKLTKEFQQKQYLYQAVHKDRQDHQKASKKDYL